MPNFQIFIIRDQIWLKKPKRAKFDFQKMKISHSVVTFAIKCYENGSNRILKSKNGGTILNICYSLLNY